MCHIIEEFINRILCIEITLFGYNLWHSVYIYTITKYIFFFKIRFPIAFFFVLFEYSLVYIHFHILRKYKNKVFVWLISI